MSRSPPPLRVPPGAGWWRPAIPASSPSDDGPPRPGPRRAGPRGTAAALRPQVALAPYRHLEEDMRSLKQVLEMKNQQIHQQEKRIAELEKLVSRGVFPGRPRPSPPPSPSPPAASGPGPRPARCSR